MINLLNLFRFRAGCELRKSSYMKSNVLKTSLESVLISNVKKSWSSKNCKEGPAHNVSSFYLYFLCGKSVYYQNFPMYFSWGFLRHERGKD